MAETNDKAFCPLLWQANGGPVREDGLPVFGNGQPIKGNCDHPQDCFRCNVMDACVNAANLNGVTTIWVCPDCCSEALKQSKKLGILTRLPGYYTEGWCQRPQCGRAARAAPEKQNEARFSPLLQLMTVVGSEIP